MYQSRLGEKNDEMYHHCGVRLGLLGERYMLSFSAGNPKQDLKNIHAMNIYHHSVHEYSTRMLRIKPGLEFELYDVYRHNGGEPQMTSSNNQECHSFE